MDMPERIAHAASNTSYVASGGAVVVGGLSTNEVIAIGGLLLAFATFIVNWVYRHKLYKLELAKTEQQLKVMGENNDDV